MKTIALRFADNLAPKEGTISAHNSMIEKNGFVWYGKFGARVAERIKEEILANRFKQILLIHSGTNERYWLHIDCISYQTPRLTEIPEYYRDIANSIKTWFRVIKIEKADKNVMSRCIVPSSGRSLSIVSKYSMSPYYIIEYD